MSDFPSLKGKKLIKILKRNPLNYEVTRQSGSHKTLESRNYPRLTFSFRDSQEISGGVVSDILIKQVGLSPEEARRLVK